MKIVYMGTPDFAVNPLNALIENGYEVVGVFTQPDKPVGRKAILTPPPVKKIALDNDIPVFQPNSLKNGEGVRILEELKPDVVIVVAYGKILPKNVLDYPKYGCVNVHGSLLPEYRGAAPMQMAIIDGKKVIDKVIMDGYDKQTLMSKLDGGYYGKFTLTDVTDSYNKGDFFTTQTGKENSNPVSNATKSANAGNNAVNCVIKYLGELS